MKRFRTIAFSAVLMVALKVPGQPGFNYQMTMISNPSLTGIAGNGMVRISYMNHFPGNGFNLHSACLSYDGFFPALHGGAGVYLSDEYLGGIMNNLRGGFSYAYFLRATGDLYVNAGLSASFYHRGFNFGNALLPDQIDPLLGAVYPSAEVLQDGGRTIFDLAAGFLFMYRNFFGGLSVTHLTEPDPSQPGYADGSLKRTLLVHAAADLGPGSGKNMRTVPMLMAEISGSSFNAGAGAVLQSKHLSVNCIILSDNFRNADLQAGFSADAGSLSVYYSYRFNMIRGKDFLPFSLLHHTGLTFSLYNVDKRKIIKTINFPDL